MATYSLKTQTTKVGCLNQQLLVSFQVLGLHCAPWVLYLWCIFRSLYISIQCTIDYATKIWILYREYIEYYGDIMSRKGQNALQCCCNYTLNILYIDINEWININNDYVWEGVISFLTSDDTTHYLHFVVTTRLSIKYDHLRVKGLNTVQLAWDIDGHTWISIYLQLTTLQSHLGNPIKCLHIIITLFTSHVWYDKTATWCCYYYGGFLSIPHNEKFHLQLLEVS